CSLVRIFISDSVLRRRLLCTPHLRLLMHTPCRIALVPDIRGSAAIGIRWEAATCGAPATGPAHPIAAPAGSRPVTMAVTIMAATGGEEFSVISSQSSVQTGPAPNRRLNTDH